MAVKFEKLKLPSYGQMGGVAFHGSDLQLSGNGPRVLIFGGQRQGISGAMFSFEQSSGDGYLQLPEQGEDAQGPPPAPRTQASLTSIGAEPQTTLILFGGFALNIGCVNDVWKCVISLDLASMPVPNWSKLDPAGEPPSPRYGHSATYLGPQKDKLAIFGGQDPVQQFGDLFILAHEPAAWSRPSVSGSAPSARMKHSATMLGASGQILVFGGFNKSDRVLDDAYMLDLGADGASAAWTALAPEPPVGSKSIPARAQHAAACTQDGRYVFIFGGYDGFKSLNDLWLLDCTTQSLRDLAVETPAPDARSRHTMHMVRARARSRGGRGARRGRTHRARSLEGLGWQLEIAVGGPRARWGRHGRRGRRRSITAQPPHTDCSAPHAAARCRSPPHTDPCRARRQRAAARR